MNRRIPLSIELPRVSRMLMYTLLGLLLSTTVYFFIKMNMGAERGYALKENQLRKNELEDQNRTLEQQIIDAQSLTELNKSRLMKEMVSPDKSEYVAPRSPLSRRR